MDAVVSLGSQQLPLPGVVLMGSPLDRIKSTIKATPGLLAAYIAILRRLDAVIKSIYNIYYSPVAIPLLDAHTLRRKLSALDAIAASPDDKTYYVIRRDCKTIGLYTYVTLFLSHFAYAVGKGYIPVIDMKHLPSMYLTKSQLGKENAWEYYYKQPYDTNLDDVMRCGRYLLSSSRYNPIPPDVNSLYDPKEGRLWAALYDKSVVLNDATRAYVEAECSALLGNGRRVLGVLYRGTDYAQGRPFRHPIQPQLEDVLARAKESMESWDCHYVYIATEEKRAVEAFRAVFPGRVLINDRVYYDELGIDYSKRDIATTVAEGTHDRYRVGLVYLASIMILARCNCLVAGMCAGTYAAVYINGGQYEHKYFFDLGRYGVDD
ncbi:MAG: hypothetical protein HYR74_11495 [Candidatus Eisenbacteria bacterium]|nr:hypothetical protein [Candidatus Eisenbacteria bacterium]